MPKTITTRLPARFSTEPKVWRLLPWLPVLLMTLLIFWLSSRQYTAYFADLDGQPYRLFQKYLQYPAHLGEYAILGLLWMWPLSRYSIKRTPAAGLMFGAILVTAVLDESIQWYTPSRHFSSGDLCLDLAGGLVAMIASPWIFPTVAQRR